MSTAAVGVQHGWDAPRIARLGRGLTWSAFAVFASMLAPVVPTFRALANAHHWILVGWFGLVIIFGNALTVASWLLALYHCIRFGQPGRRAAWFWGLVLGNIIASWIYWLSRPSPASQASSVAPAV